MVEGVIRRGFLRRLTGVVPGTRIGRVRWPRALLMRPWRWHDDGAGKPERAATTGKGPGDLVAVPMPEPGEPPVTRPRIGSEEFHVVWVVWVV
jgi:hypothetical protein